MLNLRPHEYRKLPNSEMHGLARLDPYLRLSIRKDDGDQEVVYLQRGAFFDQAGHPISDEQVPDWIWAQLEKTSDDAKKAVGFVKSAPQEPEEAA